MKPILVLSTEAFAKNILFLRDRMGLSNADFCRQFDMELWMMDRIENDDPDDGFDIYVDSFRKILTTFDLNGETFIFGDISVDM